MPEVTHIGDNKEVVSNPNGVTIYNGRGDLGAIQVHFNEAQTQELWQALNRHLADGGNVTRALLMGGPRHGETLCIPGSPNHIKTLTSETRKIDVVPDGTCGFPLLTKEHVYTRTALSPGGLVIYEHDSLADENITLKAERLDEACGIAKRAREDAEHARNSTTMLASAAIEDREKARENLSDALRDEALAATERNALTKEFGI